MAKPLTSCNYCKLLLLFFFIGTYIFPGIGQTEELADAEKLNDFLKQIEEKAATVESFSCNFEQRKHLSIFSKPILFYGTLSIDRPDKMRWEITKPLPSILLLDGENGMQCSGSRPPKKFNTISDPIMKIVSKQLWSWLSGDYIALRENYSISMTDDHGIDLKPLTQGVAQVVRSVQVHFNPTTLQPTKVTINEAGKDRTEIFFSEYILNNSFPGSHFSKCFTTGSAGESGK